MKGPITMTVDQMKFKMSMQLIGQAVMNSTGLNASPKCPEFIGLNENQILHKLGWHWSQIETFWALSQRFKPRFLQPDGSIKTM
jgi:hypothetical protein